MQDVTLRLRPDKVGSVCHPFGFGPYLKVRQEPECREGTAVVCRVLSTREEYGHLELPSGRLSKLVPGDLIVGVLGNRAALRGFAGRVPTSLTHGGELHLLNVGGVFGLSDGTTVGLGDPIRLEVLGVPLLDDQPARLSDFALPRGEKSGVNPPVIAVVGTCMNAGKSTAASVLIRYLRAKGWVVHAGKSTGVGAIRDALSFRDNGASVALSFIECGIPSTAYRTDVPEIYQSLIGHLSADDPDAIVMELGDGLLGAYGVDAILESNPGFKTCIVAANDVVGGWAAVERLRALGLHVAVVTGPATDNVAGVAKFKELGVAAANIMREPKDFCAAIEEALQA